MSYAGGAELERDWTIAAGDWPIVPRKHNAGLWVLRDNGGESHSSPVWPTYPPMPFTRRLDSQK
jgi:hypothetical protein